MRSFAHRRHTGSMAGSQICGRGLAGMAMPPPLERIAPATAPSWIQRASSSGVSRSSPIEK